MSEILIIFVQPNKKIMRIYTKIALLLISFSSILIARAQQDVNVAGGMFYISGSVTSNRLEADLYIENRNLNDLAILVDRDISQMHPSHRTYYCWEQCYDTTVGLSPEPKILPGSTIDSTSFHSYLYTFNTAGVSRVTYTFFDQNNPTDTALATITYDVLTSGIAAVEKSQYTLSNPSPNPANNMTSFSYTAPSSNSKLVIRDLIGNIVSEHLMSGSKGVIMIPTAELKAGVYICSLVTSGSSISSSKLVVSHR